MRMKIRVLTCLAAMLCISAVTVYAADGHKGSPEGKTGGGYAATGQLSDVSYSAKIYDATNGLPTSDANWILAANDGYIWIGGYAGIIKYDGASFERMDSTEGLTSGRVLFEDRRGRIWVGTNDNGVVVIDDDETMHLTYEDGLTSSSIRGFAEDAGNVVYIGSTNGICAYGPDGTLSVFEEDSLRNKTINHMTSTVDGRVYGSTEEGDIFCIIDGTLEMYTSSELGFKTITAVCPDPANREKVYFGTTENVVYNGVFGQPSSKMKVIRIAPVSNVYWISSACDRVWICSEESVGYLDEDQEYHILENLPMNSSIYMLTEDYQGNLWVASSRQGVMKIVTNNFRDLTQEAHLEPSVVNSTCLRDDLLYVGTDDGLWILDDITPVTNDLTRFLHDTRIRCISKDDNDDLWISTYTNDKGLVCYTPEGKIISLTTQEGMPGNQIRCTVTSSGGLLYVGTNEGLAVVKDRKVIRTAGASDTIANTFFLTVEEGDDGNVYAGTDGDGIYVIGKNSTYRLGRSDGLSSDVILRIKKDEKRGVYWIITSNSVEYMKNEKIYNVTTFPYNNNFDICFADNDKVWVLSSYGVFVMDAQSMIDDNITDYKLYSIANGLPGAVTANSFSELTEGGDLYMSCRNGVSKVNINNYFDQSSAIRTGIRSITCSEGEVMPDESGRYTIPARAGRIQITPAILNYTMTDPMVHAYLEGNDDGGITATQSSIPTLEYTGLGYGDYVLHVQIVDDANGSLLQDDSYMITKKPQLYELMAVRILLVAFLAALAGLIVWRVLTGTVIRKQYEQIRQAKDEAERANTAKTRFLANMSHEIRTPINTIMGMDEMILREDATDVPKGYFMSVVNYALDIRRASESLLGLINDLLDMSKIESGKMHLVERGYDVAEMLRAVVSMIRVRGREKDLAFDVDIDPTLPVRLYGDDGKIKQVVLNLLTNAVKYTDTGGFKLTVSVLEKDDSRCNLRFSVKDTGIGIKPEDMDKLFTAYERLDEEKNSGIQGTGLGLDISRRFAQLLGGSLTCESTYGEGSEFIFTFTQGIVEAKKLGEFTEEDDNNMKGPYVPQFVAPEAEILVVDDNPMNLSVIKGLLKSTKMFVTTASSGAECLEKIKYGNFNVVLLDHMMPGMDGVETLQRIRETHPDLPVYALTANSTAGEDFYISNGFNGYLAKPIDSYTLEKTILAHLPEEIVMKTAQQEAPVQEVFPEDKKWLYEVDGISVDEGIKNSGGIETFISSIELFYDTIDGNAKVIEDAYNENDIKLYTVKVHALKSSARIIGASQLSELCQKLEDAGNKQDMGFIDDNTNKMLGDLRSYSEKLSKVREQGGSDDRPPIPEDELADAYAALAEVIPNMDYDAVEMILAGLEEYKLPDPDAEKIGKIGRMLKSFEWDEMEELIKE